MSDAKVNFMGTLLRRVGEAIAQNVRERETSNQPVLNTEGERQWATAWLDTDIRRFDDEQVRAGQEPPFTDLEVDALIERTLDVQFGAGSLQQYLNDDNVQDIHVNGSNSVWIKYRDGSRSQVGAVADNDDELLEIMQNLARTRGRHEQKLDFGSPVVDMQLPNGDRLNAMCSLSSRPVMVIRRHDFSIASLEALEERGMITPGIKLFLRACVKAQRNIIVSGGTGTGKTTMLRALLNECAPEERIVTIEDNLEIGLSRFPELHPNLVETESRKPNLEGVGGIPLSQLVQHSLRQDPDRVVVGECRGAETVPMLLAMSQGNDGSMTTIHADSSASVFDRIRAYAASLHEPSIQPEHTDLLIRDAVHFVVHIGFNQAKTRVVQSIREVDTGNERQLGSNEVFAPGPDGMAQPHIGVAGERHQRALKETGYDYLRASRSL